MPKRRTDPVGQEAIRLLKRAMRVPGATQERLALSLDVSLASISRWTRGVCTPRGGAARRMVAALKGQARDR